MRALNERIAKAQQDLASAQRMAAVTGGSRAGAAGLPAGISSYITGDTRSPYYRADHGGKNYHEHLRFVSRQAAEAAYDLLVKAGIKVTEFKGRTPVGRHTPGSAHYEGLAFDVPASQVPVGQERRLTALVQQTLGIGGGAAAAQQRRGIVDTGDVTLAQVELQALRTAYNELIESKGRWDAAADTESISALTKAFSDQNQELQNTLRTDTLRAELQSKGYTAAQIDLEMKLADALDRRNRTLSEIPLSASDAIEAVNAKYRTQVDLLTKIYDLNQANANSFGFREGAQRYVESIGTMREATASLTEQGFRGLEDVIFQLTTTGAANFQAFAVSILQQTARMIIQQLVLKTIMQAIGAIGGGGADRSFGTLMAGINKYSANGNVFAANGIVPYAMGGIVNRPTLFPFANGGSIGTGLMGEAGPEAIIPLQRGANGKLGVAGGGGTTNVVVNVDASGGTAVSGDAGQAKQLGQAITAAVQAELVKQKRPGGLLAG
jgi:lambda family phage tail tape measure protein